MKKLLIITGGSKGIGKATIAKFIKDGWDAINLSRSACELDKVINIQIDFMQSDWQDKCIKQLQQACQNANKIALVHNAASCTLDTIQTVTQDALTRELHMNTIIPAVLTQTLMPYIPKHSAIIYLGSTLSEKAVPGCLSYVTSKHAIAGLMKATCQDLAGTQIHTCLICPGVTDTEMLRERCQNNEDILDMLRNINSSKRLIEPNEIADVIYFCANHAVINGSVIHAHMGQIEK